MSFLQMLLENISHHELSSTNQHLKLALNSIKEQQQTIKNQQQKIDEQNATIEQMSKKLDLEDTKSTNQTTQILLLKRSQMQLLEKLSSLENKPNLSALRDTHVWAVRDFSQ